MKLSPTEIFTGKKIFFIGGTGFVRKVALLIFSLVIVVTIACSSNPIVGKWKAIQKYDRFHETWVTTNEEVYIEFSADGKYSATTPGKLTVGTYEVDQSVKPSHLVFKDESSGTLNGAFTVEKNILTLKGSKDTSQFPTTIEPGTDEPSVELVRFERQGK